MTPAIKSLESAGVAFKVHKYDPKPTGSGDAEPGWGEAAAIALGLEPRTVFKTLVVAIQGVPNDASGRSGATHGIAVLPVSDRLDLGAVSAALGAKRATLADPEDAERLTGYVLGGISPFGQKRRLPLVLHHDAAEFEAIHVSGGRRGLEIEIAPDVLLAVTQGVMQDITR